MPYVNIPESNLAPLLATQVGKLEGIFSSKVEKSLNNIEKAFEKGCPNEQQIQNISNQLQAIKELSVGITDRLNKIKALTGPLRKNAKAIGVGATVLKALPIPGLSLTAGATTTFSDTLHTVKEFSTQLITTADSIDTVISQTENLKSLLQKAANFIERVETALEFCKLCKENGGSCSEECIKTIVTGTEEQAQECINSLNESLGSESNLLTAQPLEETINTTPESYKGYTIRIVEVPSDYTKAVLRQAVAENKNGVVEFRGNKSFSSSTDILKKEIKFYIDSKTYLEERKEDNIQPSNFFISNQAGTGNAFDEFSIYDKLSKFSDQSTQNSTDNE